MHLVVRFKHNQRRFQHARKPTLSLATSHPTLNSPAHELCTHPPTHQPIGPRSSPRAIQTNSGSQHHRINTPTLCPTMENPYLHLPHPKPFRQPPMACRKPTSAFHLEQKNPSRIMQLWAHNCGTVSLKSGEGIVSSSPPASFGREVEVRLSLMTTDGGLLLFAANPSRRRCFRCGADPARARRMALRGAADMVGSGEALGCGCEAVGDGGMEKVGHWV